MPAGATWRYKCESLSGAGTVTLAGRCVGMSIKNKSTSANAVFTISSGDQVTLLPGDTLNVNTKGKLQGAVVTWVSGNIQVFIEVVD